MLLLLNLNTIHNVSNIFTDELFSFLKKELLPKNNKIPSSSYEAHMLIKSFGLIYDSIHACVNGCVFFQRTLKHVHVCPKCDSNKYVDGLGDVPRKVLRHFPLIPRLIWMYKCKSFAKKLTWHKDGASFDGLLQSMLDSKIWKYIRRKWPKFVVDLPNIRLGLALDGVNLFGDLSSCHSTWLMVFQNYNLPPWLVTKRHFFKLTLIIPSK